MSDKDCTADEVCQNALAAMESSSSNKYYPITIGSTGYDTKVPYLIKNYLPAQSFGILYGPSGHFKSFHAISWACSIATGKDWNECKSVLGSVLYIAGEGGLGVPRRIRGWEQVHNTGEEIGNLWKVNMPVPVSNPVYCEYLLNSIREIEFQTGEKIALVVIDTLARCFGGDENKTQEMGNFIAGCDHIKNETGATVLVVHHSGKDQGAGPRGSSSLPGACDFVFCVQRIPDEQGYILKNTKAKDSCEQPEQAFYLTDHVLFLDDDGDEVTTLVAGLNGEFPPDEPDVQNLKSDNHRAVMRVIHNAITKPGQTVPYVFVRDELKAQGLYKKDFSGWIGELCKKRLIKNEDGNISLLTPEFTAE